MFKFTYYYYILICFMYVYMHTIYILYTYYSFEKLLYMYFLLNAAEIPKEAEGSIRLLGGSGSHEGLVEMYLLRKWTIVCRYYLDMSVAEVVCHQLGYSGAVAAPRGSYFNVETQRRPYGVYNLQCSGYEVNITHCEKSFSDQCSQNFAGVICSPAC